MDLFEHVDGLRETLRRNDPEDPDLTIAFGVLAQFLERVLRRQGFQADNADMLAIESTEKVLLEIERFQNLGEHSFAAWCRTLAINHAKNWIRSQAKHNANSLDIDPKSEASYVDRRESTVDEPSELAMKAWVNLGQMNPQDRKILLLRAVEELSFPDIAVRLEIKVNTARQRFHRACQKLRDQMQ